MDLKEGGVVTIDDKELYIEPCEYRIYGTLWKNGSMIEVLYYPPNSIDEEDFHPSDRMHLFITDCNGSKRGWRLNVEDALEIIEGLAKGIKLCLQDRVPVDAATD